MDHVFPIGVSGVVTQLKGREYDYSDGRANGIYVPKFRNVLDKHPKFIRGYGMQGNVQMGYNYARAKYIPGFGKILKQQVRDTPELPELFPGCLG